MYMYECLQIIVANPKTAGVARWIFLALWGSKMKKGDAAAKEYVTKVRRSSLFEPSLTPKPNMEWFKHV